MVWDTTKQEPGGALDRPGVGEESKSNHNKTNGETEHRSTKVDAKASHPLAVNNANVSKHVNGNGHVPEEIKPSKNGDISKSSSIVNGTGKEKAKDRKPHKEKKHKKHSDERKHKSHKDHKQHKHHKKHEQSTESKSGVKLISKPQTEADKCISPHTTKPTNSSFTSTQTELDRPTHNGDKQAHSLSAKPEFPSCSDNAKSVEAATDVGPLPAENLNNGTSSEPCTALPSSLHQSTVKTADIWEDAVNGHGAKTPDTSKTPGSTTTLSTEQSSTDIKTEDEKPMPISESNELAAQTTVTSETLVDKSLSDKPDDMTQTDSEAVKPDEGKKVEPITIKLNSDSSSSCVVSKDSNHSKGLLLYNLLLDTVMSSDYVCHLCYLCH